MAQKRWPSKTTGVQTIRVHRHYVSLVRDVECRECGWIDRYDTQQYQAMIRHIEANPGHRVRFTLVDHCGMTDEGIVALGAQEFQELAGVERQTTCPACGLEKTAPPENAPGGMPLCRDCLHAVQTASKERENLEEEFAGLVRRWKAETGSSSSSAIICSHPAYLMIIAAGEPVLPLIFREMEKRPGHWSPALTAITGHNPITEEMSGRMQEIADAWLRWARENRPDGEETGGE